MLSPELASQCIQGDVGFCQFIKPLYPANLSPYCIIALFVGNNDDIRKKCIINY